MQIARYTRRLPVLAILSLLATLPVSAQDVKPAPRVPFSNVNVFDGVSDKLIRNANARYASNLLALS